MMGSPPRRPRIKDPGSDPVIAMARDRRAKELENESQRLQVSGLSGAEASSGVAPLRAGVALAGASAKRHRAGPSEPIGDAELARLAGILDKT